MAAYDRLLVAHADDVSCCGYEYVRRARGYAFYGSHFGHGYDVECYYALFNSFVGCFDIYSLMNPDKTRMKYKQKNVKFSQCAKESSTI